MLLHAGMDPTQRDENGKLASQLASSSGHATCAECIVNFGPSVMAAVGSGDGGSSSALGRLRPAATDQLPPSKRPNHMIALPNGSSIPPLGGQPTDSASALADLAAIEEMRAQLAPPKGS